jgi:uncharacterized membrane protein YbjE (DUF340 family)
MLTCILLIYKIGIQYLNKKSTQKQKRLRNNGFSQAVVPLKEDTKTK